MTNAASIEVYGPLDAVERAALNLPGAVGSTHNKQGALVIDLGSEALIVADDIDLTVVIVDGPNTDTRSVEVFDQLAAVLPYRMDLTDADASGIVRQRDAIPA